MTSKTWLEQDDVLRAKQIEALESALTQVKHGYTDPVAVVEALVLADQRYQLATRFESELVTGTVNSRLVHRVTVGLDDLTHKHPDLCTGFDGSNAWGPCKWCGRQLEDHSALALAV